MNGAVWSYETLKMVYFDKGTVAHKILETESPWSVIALAGPSGEGELSGRRWTGGRREWIRTAR